MATGSKTVQTTVALILLLAGLATGAQGFAPGGTGSVG